MGSVTKKFISSPLFKKIWTPSSSCDSSSSSGRSSEVLYHKQPEVVQKEVEKAQEAFCDPAQKCGEMVADRWRLVSLLGTGTYGAVYMAEEGTEKMAIKVLWKAGLDAEQLMLQRLEVDINAALMAHAARKRLPRGVHPNIVPMRHFHEDDECLYLVMDLHHGTDLYEAIQDVGGLDSELVKHVFRQIVSAIDHSHSAGVFHRDLKPENVLVTPDWQCQLCDYGLSSMEEVTGELGCGSAPYMAPEARALPTAQTKQTYRCREADIWSLGVLLLNLVFACNPWKVASTADPSFAAFMNDKRVLQRQFNLSKEFFTLLSAIFDLDPEKRPTLSQIALAIEKMPSFVAPSQQYDNQVVLSSSPTDVPSIHNTPIKAPKKTPDQITPVASLHYVFNRLQLNTTSPNHQIVHHHSSSDTRRPVSGILAF